MVASQVREFEILTAGSFTLKSKTLVRPQNRRHDFMLRRRAADGVGVITTVRYLIQWL